jgi:aminomethyltransferase
VGAVDFVNDRLTNDLRRVGQGQAQYTLCCDDSSGGVVDDLIAYVRSDDEVFLVPNAANSSQVVGRLADDASGGIEVEDLHDRLAVLAVQGPRSPELVEALGLPTGHDYMAFTSADWQGVRSWSAAPATPASAASSCCRGGTTPATSGTRC